jgi:hypothetical protein
LRLRHTEDGGWSDGPNRSGPALKTETIWSFPKRPVIAALLFFEETAASGAELLLVNAAGRKLLGTAPN